MKTVKYLALSSLAASSFLFAGSAMAATTVVDGSCVSVADPSGCLFNGNINSSASGNNSFGAAQDAYNIYNDTNPTANPDINLSVLASTDDGDFGDFGTFTGAGTSSGTWNLAGYLVDFYAVKAGPNFVLYQLGAPASSGSWDTFDIPFKQNPRDLSHLVFFGQPTGAVPEPATWAMMIFGFGLMGGVMRRRKTKVTLSYA